MAGIYFSQRQSAENAAIDREVARAKAEAGAAVNTGQSQDNAMWPVRTRRREGGGYGVGGSFEGLPPIQHAPTLRPEGVPPQYGFAEGIKANLAGGVMDTFESVGTNIEGLGVLVRSDAIREAGYRMAEYYALQETKYPMSQRGQTQLWGNPHLLIDPHYLGENVARSVPSLVATLGPAVGGYGLGYKFGSKVLGWTPMFCLKTARWGAAILGGISGGLLEGSGAYQRVKEMGGSDDEALRALTLMGLSSAFLNMYSFGAMFDPPIRRIGGRVLLDRGGKIAHGVRSSFREFLTEYLEEPTQAIIVGDDLLESLRQGWNVAPASVFFGLAGAATGQSVATPQTAEAVTQDIKQRRERASGRRGDAAAAERAEALGAMGADLGDVAVKERAAQLGAEERAATEEPGSAVPPTEPAPESPAYTEIPAAELRRLADEARARESTALADALGEKDAKTFERLSNRERLTPKQDAELARIRELIDGNPELERAAYGIGEPEGTSAEELAELADAAEYAETAPEFTDEQILDTISRTLRQARDRSDPKTIITLRGFLRAAADHGLTAEQVKTAVQDDIARSFPDPDDAAFMTEQIDRMLRGEPAPESPASTDAGGETELRVNLKHIDASQAAKALIAQMNQKNGARLAKDRKRKKFAQLVEGFERYSVDELLKIEPGTPVDSHTQYAMRVNRDTAAELAIDMAPLAAAGDGQAMIEYDILEEMVGELDARAETGARQAARTLVQQKIPSRAQGEPGDVEGFVTQARDYQYRQQQHSIPANERAQLALSLPTKGRRLKYMSMMWNVGRHVPEVGYQIWIEALLTGFRTHAVSVASNALLTGWAVPRHYLAEGVGMGGVEVGETQASIAAIARSFVMGLKWVQYVAEHGQDPTGRHKMDYVEAGMAAEEAGIDAIAAPDFGVKEFPKRFFDYIKHEYQLAKKDYKTRALEKGLEAWRLAGRPTNALRTGDAMIKGMGSFQHRARLAMRQAKREGLEGDKLDARVDQLMHEPLPSMVREERAFALSNALQQPLGEGGKALQAVLKYTPFGRVVVPFLRIGVNAFKWHMSANPVLAPLLQEFRDDIKAGGARRDVALAQLEMGTMMGMIIATAAASGRLTGGWPEDKELKAQLQAQGWKPYSLHVDKQYISLEGLDPFAIHIGVFADFAQIAGEIPEPDAELLALAMGISLAKNMTSKTYMQGLSRVINAIVDNPASGGATLVRQYTGSIIPTLVRSQVQYGTPWADPDPYIRMARDKIDALKKGIPGLSTDLPPYRNAYGEAVMRPDALGWDQLSFLARSYERDDLISEVSQEVVAQGAEFDKPSEYIAGSAPQRIEMRTPSPRQGIRLTPWEYDYYVYSFGQGATDSQGRNLPQRLQALFQTTGYQNDTNGPGGGKARRIRIVVEAYKEEAERLLRDRFPELDRAVVGLQNERIEALLGPRGGASQPEISQ